jgi:hypothetical protein
MLDAHTKAATRSTSNVHARRDGIAQKYLAARHTMSSGAGLGVSMYVNHASFLLYLTCLERSRRRVPRPVFMTRCRGEIDILRPGA